MSRASAKHGWNESDSCLFPDPSLWWKPYSANSAFAARGLKALAAVWSGIVPSDAVLARDWSARAERLRVRLNAAVRASVRRDLSPPYVPPLPGVTLTFRQSLQTETPSPQQWPHRAYCELLQADVLEPELAHLVIDTMRGHGATSLGVVANVGPPSATGRDILGFISYGYARQLLQLGRVEEYLLFLYAHRHHAHTAGSWTAGEVCDITGGLPLFCIPAQLTIPLLLRWMLVFEEEDAERLHLGRAIPRDWFATGRPIAMEGAPTRWGRVDLRLQLDPLVRRLTGRVQLPEGGAAPETLLTLRLPATLQLNQVTVNGAVARLEGETLRLDTHRARIFEIEGRWT